ncbi:hypothetical protein FVER14953_20251 [Fusarium verticillioides]|nr:hypothetical protein FVER14953_20251 [Fusarium verticillioides]
MLNGEASLTFTYDVCGKGGRFMDDFDQGDGELVAAS